MKKAFFLFLLFLHITACSSMHLHAPDVHIVNMNIDDVSLFSTDLEVTVRLENEMNRELRITDSRHEIYLGNKLLGTAKSSDELAIPPRGEATQTLRLSLDHFKAFEQIESLIQNPRQAYRIESTVYLDSFLGLSHISDISEGELPFPSSH